MRTKLIIAFVVLAVVLAALYSYAQNAGGRLMAAAPVLAAMTPQQVDSIMSLLLVFGADSKTVNDVKSAISRAAVRAPAALPNLRVAKIILSQTTIAAGTSGSIPEQGVQVVVERDENATSTPSPNNLIYKVNVYEVKDNQEKRRFKSITSSFVSPPAGGESKFEVTVPGGLPYNRRDRDERRTYVVEVVIDDKNNFKESNEQDNNSWSEEWLTTYLQGQ